MRIYVGNLAYELTDDQLQAAFEEYGQVASATIVKDRATGATKGFAFVEMPEQTEGEAAINGLNGRELMGRKLNVNEARPRAEGAGGGGRRMPDGERGPQ